MDWIIRLSIGPGAIALTRIRIAPNSMAATFIKPKTACLLAT
jgi:hypothetical protein